MKNTTFRGREIRILRMRSGLLAIYKPKGYTSAYILNKIKYNLYNEISKKNNSHNSNNYNNNEKQHKIKIGHGGTLDPLAEGVLVLGINNGTKVLKTYLEGNKKYSAIGLFGKETDTLDSDGKIIKEMKYDHITKELLTISVNKFVGDIYQTPPMYSALKRGGRPLYEIARKGIVVERQPREVKVYSISLHQNQELPYFGIDIECGGGCYVRSVISDIGNECSSCAHLTSLVRTQQGPFELSDCLKENEWDYDSIYSAIDRCNKKANADIPEDIYIKGKK